MLIAVQDWDMTNTDDAPDERGMDLCWECGHPRWRHHAWVSTDEHCQAKGCDCKEFRR